MRRSDVNSALERQNAILCAGGKPSKSLSDFVPQYGVKREPPTAAQLRSKLLAWAGRRSK